MKCLSQAGKEVLKTVTQAIPSYAISVFLIPKSLCDEIERMMNSYWWGRSRGNQKGVCWTAWEKLCIRKEDGGLRF